MADDVSRVEIGFDGGLIVITKLDAKPSGRSSRRRSTPARASCTIAATTTPTYHVDVSKVGYVKHEAHVGRVGF